MSTRRKLRSEDQRDYANSSVFRQREEDGGRGGGGGIEWEQRGDERHVLEAELAGGL